ncbi:Protein of unknown function [Lentzea xinjiangensis]|uniref:DUF1015 domain-containing protein n=1 Tax=Lentzea xinjiangensis TaxID=402600 RepID=A0A1H9NAN0_9PSEU|nr:DUF1015 family protein [Lentzea xinjiangensis]SER32871.1 Protein of unknown function [Lentzea xinjiangensis]
MSSLVSPVRRGWVVRERVPGPDVDEFAEPAQVVAALARAPHGTLLAVQHPHRTPAALAAGTGLLEALPHARAELSALIRRAYREVTDVVAPYRVDGPDGTACGLLCMVDPDGIAHTEDVYPDVVAERGEVLASLGVATSAAMLIPVTPDDVLTGLVLGMTEEPAVSLVDSGGRRHWVWLVEPGARQDAFLAAAGAHPLLVADGNHRVAAARAAGLTGLLALVTSGPGLRVGPIHRAVTGTGLTTSDLVAAWERAGLAVSALRYVVDPEPGVVVVRCPDEVLRVELPSGRGADHAVVESLLLDEALGLNPESPCVRAVVDPAVEAEAVLLIAPVPLREVLAGTRMPRKSTYFTPKPRSGLLLADLTSSWSGDVL